MNICKEMIYYVHVYEENSPFFYIYRKKLDVRNFQVVRYIHVLGQKGNAATGVFIFFFFQKRI